MTVDDRIDDRIDDRQWPLSMTAVDDRCR